MRRADVYSDHYLLRTRIRLKLVQAEVMKKVRLGLLYVSSKGKRAGGDKT